MSKDMSIEKLDLQSPDLVNENFEKISALFPNCVTESANGKAIDFDLLKQELNHAVVEGNKERYRLEWPGKREAIVTANLPTTKTLRPVREDSVDFDKSENIYIEGDNLEVLKLLQESYLGKIKMIYIDPPYNTGNDFIYNDNFTVDKEKELFESGQKDDYNQRLVANPETAGRYHSDWLSMMYPRLKLARNLLLPDGVIFISIDDNEVHNLRKLLDEIFGEDNFLANIIWEKRFTRSNNSKTFATLTEHIICYRKSEALTEIKEPRNEKADSTYSNPDNDPRGIWTSVSYVNPATKEQRPNLSYELTNPVTNEKVVHPTNAWKYEVKTYEKHLEENRLYWGKEGNNTYPRLKRFLFEMDNGMVPVNFWNRLDAGTTDEASKNLDQLMEGKVFDFPKPHKLVQKAMGMGMKSDDIFLDFFSGSGTSAEAIFHLNAKDGGKRRFIQIQIPESTEGKSEAFKAGYKNICEIGKERLRRAGKSIISQTHLSLKAKRKELEVYHDSIFLEENAQKLKELQSEIDSLQSSIDNLDTGFRVYRLADSNMQDVYYKPQDYNQGNLDLFADNVKPDRTADDLLAQVMLDWGLPLSSKIEQSTINGKQLFKVSENSLYACFDKGIDEDFAKIIAKDAPLRIIFRDNGFKDDTAKTNVKQLLKQLSPETEMKVI
jgi:adenine-specific DNA-methyltransferase